MAVTAADKRRSTEIVKRLRRAYPEAHCALEFNDPLQLLIATILSAQCTDVRVNMVSPVLFRKYPTAAALAAAERKDIERIILSTGFFRSKAKSIQGCCEKLVAEHDGHVPRTLEELIKLPGVGRKTANVVLGTAYGIATGIVVDTHVARISRRLGLTKKNDAVKIEQDLMAQIPQRDWIDFSHEMIFHGRAICIARRPKCEICPLEPICPRIGVEERGEGRGVRGERTRKRKPRFSSNNGR
ncbi:MAG TPA: endonuclease III [Pirellulales bacterium]|jgi:endonuclease-3|nr:endonuclease III [Pirellulales bacterium]